MSPPKNLRIPLCSPAPTNCSNEDAVHRAVLLESIGSILGWANRKGAGDCVDEVTLSRKARKPRTRDCSLRSTAKMARKRAGRMRKSRADLEQQLEKYRHELAEAQEHPRRSRTAAPAPAVHVPERF